MKTEKKLQACTRCIMDNHNDPDLSFNNEGVCNHCLNFIEAEKKIPKGQQAKEVLEDIIKDIKEKGRNKKYDCVIGVSGGVDSTYLCLLAKQRGLRPILVHCDNNWNSELAVNNIERMATKLGFELYTNVINWEEFKDIQLSYFKAGVIDIECVTDHANIATLISAARKFGVKFILTGHNVVTEGTYLPKSWVHPKHDGVNLLAIHKKFGTVKLKTYPVLSFFNWLYSNNINPIKWVSLLNYVPYDKKEIKEVITKELDWRDYGGKHYESIFTRFYQGYILPQKFKVDKRQFHLSVLVQAGQVTREAALEEMQKPPYNAELFRSDKEYVLKKLNFTEASFNDYMSAPIHKHTEFKNIDTYWKMYFRLIGYLRPFKKLRS